MATDSRRRRIRRSFTDEFRAAAFRLVIDESKTEGQVARELDFTESGSAQLGRAAPGGSRQGQTRGADDGGARGLTRLRRETRELRMDRDILEEAAAFVVKNPQ